MKEQIKQSNWLIGGFTVGNRSVENGWWHLPWLSQEMCWSFGLDKSTAEALFYIFLLWVLTRLN